MTNMNEVLDSIQAAGTPTVYNVTMTNANTEYSQALPENTRKIQFRVQDITSDARFAYVTGKVATPTAPFLNLFAGETETLDWLKVGSATLYFASPVAGAKMEIQCWT